MSLRIGIAVLLGLLVGSAVTYWRMRPKDEAHPRVQDASSESWVCDLPLASGAAKPEVNMPKVAGEHQVGSRPIIVRWDPRLDVTNEQFDFLNWPGGLRPDSRAIQAQLGSDAHELEVRVGYTLAGVHETTILNLRDDQTADGAIQLESDTGSIDEDSSHGLTGEIHINSLDWRDPHICGTFEMHWTTNGIGRCRHGSFSIDQSQIKR